MSRTMKEVSEELQTGHEKDLSKMTRLASNFRSARTQAINALMDLEEAAESSAGVDYAEAADKINKAIAMIESIRVR